MDPAPADTIGLITSDFDLLPTNLATLSVSIGVDSTHALTLLDDVASQIASVTIDTYGGTEGFMTFDPNTLSFICTGANIEESFANMERTIALTITDEFGNDFFFETVVQVGPLEAVEEELKDNDITMGIGQKVSTVGKKINA